MKKSLACFILINFAVVFGSVGAALSQTRSSPTKSSGRPAIQKKLDWSGAWNYPSRYYSKSLEIKVLNAKKFKFTLSSANGANSGAIDGTAEIKGNRAYFDDGKPPRKDFEPYGCRLTFLNRGKTIDVEPSSECSNYGGLGVDFEASLSKGKLPLIEQNFVQLEVFPSAALDGKFKSLVGADYETFLNAFHQIYDETDSDGFGARVFSACVRGICPYSAGIIMYDERGKIWAAVINNVDDSDRTNVNYYTNETAWADKLPKTIEKWANDKKDSNKGLTIIYKSKK